MKQKHSFGYQVSCKGCGQLVSSVWAEMWLIAQGGGGLCNDCHAKETAEIAAPAAPIDATDQSALPRRRTSKEQPSDG